jgi:sulfite reductase (NADPH) hemoprotein beta-component
MSSPAKTRPPQAPVVVTANRLHDGRVVWHAGDGAWSERIAEARLYAPDRAAAAQAAAQAGERAQLVVGAYAVEVALRGGVPDPLKFRERLRLLGPSVAAEPRPALSLAS